MTARVIADLGIGKATGGSLPAFVQATGITQLTNTSQTVEKAFTGNVVEGNTLVVAAANGKFITLAATLVFKPRLLILPAPVSLLFLSGSQRLLAPGISSLYGMIRAQMRL
jgi:hypothetical protein